MIRAGLFLDLQNLPRASISRAVHALETSGIANQVVIRRGYHDWRKASKKAKAEAFKSLVDPIQITSHEKEAADRRIVADVTELLKCMPEIDVFAIATGDGGFQHLLRRIQDNGRVAIVCGPESASAKLKSSATVFLPISPVAKPAQADEAAVVDGPDQNGSAQRVIGLLQGASYVKELEDGGLEVASLANALRPFKDPRAGKSRWLIRLLKASCAGSAISLARSSAGTNYRLFTRERVPQGWNVLDK